MYRDGRLPYDNTTNNLGVFKLLCVAALLRCEVNQYTVVPYQELFLYGGAPCHIGTSKAGSFFYYPLHLYSVYEYAPFFFNGLTGRPDPNNRKANPKGTDHTPPNPIPRHPTRPSPNLYLDGRGYVPRAYGKFCETFMDDSWRLDISPISGK